MLSYPYRKGTSFSQLTLYRYAATMLLYHGLHIEQSQPIAFHIVQITRGYAVELVEDMLQLFRCDAYATVADRYFGLLALLHGSNPSAADVYFGFSVRVFDGIVQQIAEDVAEVRTVGKDGEVLGLDVGGGVDGLPGFQLVLLYEAFHDFLQGELLRMEAKRTAALHAHGENLLHQSAKPLKLLLAYSTIPGRHALS